MLLLCLYQFCSIYSTDQPAKPTITSNIINPSVGDTISLTCASATFGVESYEFKKDGVTLITSNSNTYTIFGATGSDHDGSYTCTVVKNTFPSQSSDAYTVTGESFLTLFRF